MMQSGFLLNCNTEALDLESSGLVKTTQQSKTKMRHTQSTTNITDIFSDNSHPKVLFSGGKFINRRSPKKSKGDFEIPEIEDKFENTSVTVAVRVRPFLEYEVAEKHRCIVTMKDNETIIDEGGANSLQFCFDYSFWSFHQMSSHYSSQEFVYQRLAHPLLEKSLEGFNTCLFAYGQTGSGKSYSINGNKEDPGIVPRFCDDLFDRIERFQQDDDEGVSIKVEISFYEIYNEHIYDLLASQKTRKERTQLRVREHPVLGPYIEDLSTYVATGYKDIEHWLTLGNRFRATAATGMNDRSSRSHSCFVLVLTQTRHLEGEVCSKVSKINLVDLAGSERIKTSFTNSDRLREGQSINRSLHTLGKIISLLSENEISQKRNFIPYRESVLSWLLKESLGGNSKTAMLATISPSHISANETLSTLRYAQQARNIINAAKINEDPKNRLIRELQAEIARLKNLTFSGKSPGASQKEIQFLKDQLFEKERLMADTTRTWIDRLKMTEQRKLEEIDELKRAGISLQVENTLPNLVNLNEDPQLSEMLIYILKEGITTVGRREESSNYDIKLTGALVSENHCIFENEQGIVDLKPIQESSTYVNGNLITNSLVLHHGDRIIIGGDHYFRFNHPIEIKGREFHAENTGRDLQGFAYAKQELYEKQAERIETELNLARQDERDKMIQELDSIQTAANQELICQRVQYELQLSDLTKKTEDYIKEEETYKEAQGKLGELEERIRLLEDENMAQRHVIQLGELRKQKENEDLKKYHTRLISELEKEKKKLEEEINQAREAHEKRKSVEFIPQLSGPELVRISMMLQEANAISSHIGKKVLFTREDLKNTERNEFDSTQSKVGIRLYNTENKTTTLWDLEKFENQLLQLRELYQGELNSSVIKTSDIFDHPDDQWKKDLGLDTPGKSRTIYNNTINNHDSSSFNLGKLPSLPSSLPASLLSILTSSTEDLNAPIDIERISCDGNHTSSNYQLPQRLVGAMDGTTLTSHLKHSKDNVEMSFPSTTLVTPKNLFNSIRSVPELCSERMDRLLIDLKRNRKSSSLEKFLIHSEDLIVCAEEFMKYLTSKMSSLCIPLAESDVVRYATFNMSISFEMVVTYGSACCQNIISSSQCEEIEKVLFEVGMSVKQMLLSTEPCSHINIRKTFSELTDQLNSVVGKISQDLLAYIVHTQVKSRKTSKGGKITVEHQVLDIDLQAYQFYSHHGRLTNSICNGVLVYINEVCLGSEKIIQSCYQQSNEIFQVVQNDSLLLPEVLSAICKVFLSVQKFVSAINHVTDNLNRPTNDLEPIFNDIWSRVAWILNTIICIENCVVRLLNNIKESIERHGELEKIVSQTNVIAFHTMSATTSLEELQQQGYNLFPENIILEPLSKEVIRSAKILNNLAKRCSGFATSLATTHCSVRS